MREDNGGFPYPKIDIHVCINCGLCEKVCPVINQANKQKPLSVYAAKNKNEAIRKHSSSGGIFSLLAEYVLSQNGIVFGARFNDKWEVIHDYTETIEGLATFRGSKYVQSNINDNFIKAEQFLQSGRIVLFSGTPCQIAGLRLFLQKEYENLLTVDFVCHGVPSPKVWRMYLQELINSKNFQKETKTISDNFSIDKITNIEFRDKSFGWKNYRFRIDIGKSEKTISYLEASGENIFMQGFLKDLYLRPACYECPSKCFKSGSDITIGDFWGVEHVLPDFDDDKGISLVMINTNKALKCYQNIEINSIETSYENALSNNPAMEKSAKMNPKRLFFFEKINKMDLFLLINKLTKRTLITRLKAKISNFAKRTKK
jgi:coenzyme F420-reducing hydrogenase beta subunit